MPPLLLPAPSPADPVADQGPEPVDSSSDSASVTSAFVCHHCRRIVYRYVTDMHLPLGSTICFGTPAAFFSVAVRRDNPHPFDHLLDPDRNPEDRSVAFTSVVCEACYAPLRGHYADNAIKLKQWQASHAQVLALCNRWNKAVAGAFREHIRIRIQEFEVSHLPEIIGNDTYTLLVDRRLPYRQRRQRFEAVLEERQSGIEAYLTAGFQLEAVWDSKAFDAAVERSGRLARDLGLTGSVGITRPLEPPRQGPFGVVSRAAPDVSGVAAAAMAWPALQSYEEFDPTAMLDQARARIRLPKMGGFVQQLQHKCRELANTHFLLLRCERRWTGHLQG